MATEAKQRRGKRGHGEGTIGRRPDGRWIAQVMVGYKLDGKKDVRTVYGKTRAECQARLDGLRSRAAGGQLADADKQRETVAGYLERWVDAAKTSVKPRTHERYAEIVRLHLTPGLGRHKLAALRPDAVQRFYAAKLDAPLSAQTVVHLHRVLHRALEMAVKWGYVPRNVCDAVDPPKVQRREMRPPSPDELARLIDVAEAANDRLAALWTVAAYSGARQGELLGLTWDDVDLDAGTMTVRRTLVRVTAGVPTYGEPKTSGSRRTIALPSEAVTALRAHRARQNAERLKLGEGWTDYGLVFTSAIGTPLDKTNVTHRFKRAAIRAGLPAGVRFHDLRHAHATAMLAAQVHPKVAADRLGHATTRLTLDWYTHAVTGMDTDAAQRVQQAIRGSVSG